jgi:hypothetical protein
MAVKSATTTPRTTRRLKEASLSRRDQVTRGTIRYLTFVLRISTETELHPVDPGPAVFGDPLVTL